jgi:hypothetical protein
MSFRGRITASESGMPAINILESNDVIFSQVASRLDLDELQRDLAGIFHAMMHAKGDVSRFILFEQERFFPARYECRAVDDDPVLSPVVVLLEREP